MSGSAETSHCPPHAGLTRDKTSPRLSGGQFNMSRIKHLLVMQLILKILDHLNVTRDSTAAQKLG
jgi:hypothetical protein